MTAKLLPLAYPDVPLWVLRTLFWLGVAIIVGSILFFINDYLIRPHLIRGIKMVPLLMIICGILFILGGITYHLINKTPQPKQPVSAGSVVQQPKQPTAEEIASEIARKLPAETQRAWITLENIMIEGPLTIADDDTYLHLVVIVKNYGTVPATNIMIIPQLTSVAIKDGLDLTSAVSKALDISKNMEKIKILRGDILAPTKILAKHHGVIPSCVQDKTNVR